jgi:hypothetical protein
MFEEEIRQIVREEIEKQLKEYVVTLIPHPEKIAALRAVMKAASETAMKSASVSPVKPTPVKPRPQPQEVMENEEGAFEEPGEEDEHLGEDDNQELEWEKEQDGVLEKGETQIWRYGQHLLTVWTEGKKYYAQVNNEKPEILWKQSDLLKVQKRIEGM